ncbi:hypothetical protein [Streptodolium elevatio]
MHSGLSALLVVELRLKAASAAGLASLLLSALLSAPAAPASAAPTIPAAAPALELIPQSRYIERFGAQRLAQAALTKIPAQRPARSGQERTAAMDPPLPWHNIAWVASDADARDLPTRRGNSELGYLHYSERHNVRYSKPILIAYTDTKPAVIKGTHLEYVAILTDRLGIIYAKLRVVNEQSPVTEDKRYKTPDGRPIGTITAFCEGVNKCPDQINQS